MWFEICLLILYLEDFCISAYTKPNVYVHYFSSGPTNTICRRPFKIPSRPTIHIDDDPPNSHLSHILPLRFRDSPALVIGRVRYVMKSGLKFLPLIGFYLGPCARGGVFVKRTSNKNSTAPNDSQVVDDRVQREHAGGDGAVSSRSSSLDSVESDDAVDDDHHNNNNHHNNSNNVGVNRTRDGLRRILRWRSDDGVATWLVVYPEGTRFDPYDADKLKNSKTYAMKRDLPSLEVTH